jgi:hypothetical protein
MNEAVHIRPSDLVFNLDEVGILKWEDRKSKRAVVPMIANGHSSLCHQFRRDKISSPSLHSLDPDSHGRSQAVLMGGETIEMCSTPKTYLPTPPGF